MAGKRDVRIQSKWVWRGGAIALLVIGWFFILLQNNFHVTPSVVFVCMGFFAGVAAIFTLFQTGAHAVASSEEEVPTWTRSVGPRADLEREKRTLLKAIKEAEFDHEMGKLSKADAESMIATYRARAIEVIKELERQGNASNSVRAEIEREVRARLAVSKADGKKKKADKPRRKPGEAAREAAKAAAAAAEAAQAAAAAAVAAASPSSELDEAAAEDAADAAADVARAAAKRAEEAALAAREAADADDSDGKRDDTEAAR